MRAPTLGLAGALLLTGSLYSPLTRAADVDPVGVWDLVEFVSIDPATGTSSWPLGRRTLGRLMYTVGGHMSAVLTGEDRKPPTPGDAGIDERSRLYLGMAAYAGSYRVSGSTVTHHVTVAGDPSWVGSDQIRHVRVQGNELTITAEVVFPSGEQKQLKLLWQRIE